MGDSESITCPYCGESGFDGRGSWRVAAETYYMHGCWNCGGEFLTEVPTDGEE